MAIFVLETVIKWLEMVIKWLEMVIFPGCFPGNSAFLHLGMPPGVKQSVVWKAIN